MVRPIAWRDVIRRGTKELQAVEPKIAKDEKILLVYLKAFKEALSEVQSEGQVNNRLVVGALGADTNQEKLQEFISILDNKLQGSDLGKAKEKLQNILKEFETKPIAFTDLVDFYERNKTIAETVFGEVEFDKEKIIESLEGILTRPNIDVGKIKPVSEALGLWESLSAYEPPSMNYDVVSFVEFKDIMQDSYTTFERFRELLKNLNQAGWLEPPTTRYLKGLQQEVGEIRTTSRMPIHILYSRMKQFNETVNIFAKGRVKMYKGSKQGVGRNPKIAKFRIYAAWKTSEKNWSKYYPELRRGKIVAKEKEDGIVNALQAKEPNELKEFETWDTDIFGTEVETKINIDEDIGSLASNLFSEDINYARIFLMAFPEEKQSDNNFSNLFTSDLPENISELNLDVILEVIFTIMGDFNIDVEKYASKLEAIRERILSADENYMFSYEDNNLKYTTKSIEKGNWVDDIQDITSLIDNFITDLGSDLKLLGNNICEEIHATILKNINKKTSRSFGINRYRPYSISEEAEAAGMGKKTPKGETKKKERDKGTIQEYLSTYHIPLESGTKETGNVIVRKIDG